MDWAKLLQERSGCMTGGAQSLLTQPQQKVLHVQSHAALLITEPQLRSIALEPPREAGSLIFDPNITGRPPPAI